PGESGQTMASQYGNDHGEMLAVYARHPLRNRHPSTFIHGVNARAIPDSRTTPPSSLRGRWARRSPQRVQRPVDEIADALEGDVGLRLPRERGRVVRVVALAREHRGDPLPPVRLDRGAEPRLVIDEDVVLGGKARLDVVQLQLLVHVDQDVALDGLEQTRVMD